ncbi:MAG: PsbP-related protein [Minisyncoccia bacterium]
MDPNIPIQIQNPLPPVPQKHHYFVIVLVLICVLLLMSGYLVFQNVREEQKEVVVVSESVTVPQDDISTWKTYRNEEYGFEFKYPSDWEIINNGLIKPNGREEESEKIYFFPDFNNDNLEIEAWFVQLNGYSDSHSLVEIDGVRAIRSKESHDISGIVTYILLKTIPNRAVLNFQIRGSSPEGLKIYDQILSTFKFI